MASDSAARGLKIVKLNGRNFQSWKFNMKCLLMERGLRRYADDTNLIDKPEVKVEGDNVTAEDVKKSKEKLNEYNLKADQAYSLIALHVEPDLQIHVSTKRTADEAWANLKEAV